MMQPNEVIFVDLEASSLVEGYPIEVGWAIVRDFKITTESHLIRPTLEWYFDDFRWSTDSEAVHRITRSNLLEQGKLPAEVAARMTELFSGKILYSDAPSYDFAWIVELFHGALNNRSAVPLKLADVSDLYEGDDTDERKYEREVRKRKKFKVKHRAAADALNLALIWCHSRRGIKATQFEFPNLPDSWEILLDH